MKITKEVQWDMGHRVMNHHSKCRNLHGHRYRLEVCMKGDIVTIKDISDEGMVIDFGDIKTIVTQHIHDVLDHGFMVWEKDKVMVKFFKQYPDQKHIIVPFTPTSENIAAWIFIQLDKKFEDKYGTGLKLHHVKLWETPTSVAICTRNDIKPKKDLKKPYNPSLKDKNSLVNYKNKLKVSGDKVFASLQGEGITTGKPSVFLRLHGCNLHCGKDKGWACDTWYTWDKNSQEFWTESKNWSFPKTINEINNTWDSKYSNIKEKRLVVTGGEPLLQQEKIAKLITKLPNWSIEIETNGTIRPLDSLKKCQFNCSPKLKNSGNLRKLRYKPTVLKYMSKLPNCWFKFVASNSTDIDEIKNIITNCSIDSNRVLVMPEGQSVKEMYRHEKTIHNLVMKNGWKITLRSQLIWYGNKRRT